MTDRDRNRPLEESPEVAAAVDDDSTVPQLRTGGGADRDNPSFTEPDGAVPDTGSTETSSATRTRPAPGRPGPAPAPAGTTSAPGRSSRGSRRTW